MQPGEYIVRSISHEVAHANDWIRNRKLSSEERLDLALAVAKRVSAPNRFKSAFVEKIGGRTPEEQMFDRSVEYFAEISAQYISDASKLSVEDFIIVDYLARRGDAKFDWREANQRGKGLTAEIFHRKPPAAAYKVAASGK
jgi:hypothetical protein